jgi:hypothetical protein
MVEKSLLISSILGQVTIRAYPYYCLELAEKPKKLICGEENPGNKCSVHVAVYACTSKVN